MDRYNCHPDALYPALIHTKDSEGTWVRYSDVESLQTRLKDAEEKLERAVEWIKNEPYYLSDFKKQEILEYLTPEQKEM